MTNRAERRAQAKQARKGIPSQYDATNSRGRSGVVDEYALQERSRRLIEQGDAQWKPSATIEKHHGVDDPSLRNPHLAKKPHSTRQILRMIAWGLISVSVIAFIALMWLPTLRLRYIAIIAFIFAIGVCSLFFVAGDSRDNPNLDEHGTAV